MMRAKMRVSAVTEAMRQPREGPAEKCGETLMFHAVAKSNGYPADGSDEDNNFAKWSPSATLTMQVHNPALWGQFKPGDTFYVDFTPAPQAAALPQAHSPSAA